MKILKIAIFLFASIAVSCDDFLHRPPLDQIGPDSYWKTSKDLELYVLQYYPQFSGHGVNGPGARRLEDGTDNVIGSIEDPVLNGDRGNTAGTWRSDWSDIRSINIFFKNYLQVEDDLDQYSHYLGEAHFFKAWFYFELLQKYGDVPWYSEPLYPESEGLSKPRDPRTLVIDSILAHLDQAILYLNLRADLPEGNNRINKEAALAFKTRVALFEATWQKYHAGTPFATEGANPQKYFQACIDAAEELINGNYTAGIYSTGTPSEDYFTLFGLDDMGAIDEVLFYKASNLSEGLGNDAQNNAPGSIGATFGLVSSYLSKEGTPYNYHDLASAAKGNAFLAQIAQDCDPRLKSTVWIPGDLVQASSGLTFDKPFIDRSNRNLCPTGFQIKKYYNPYAPNAWAVQTGGVSETGYIIFRFAEVLLNYAEAKYELEGTVAYEQLNRLRARAGMPDFTVNAQSSDPQWLDYGYPVSDELYEIRRERRVELALEGQRISDYKRWAAHALFKGKRPKGYPFNPAEFPDLNISLDPNGLIDFFQDRLPGGYGFREGQDYLDPVPLDELTLNPNLTQNPGW